MLLRELIEQAISGTEQAVAAEERDYVRAMLAEPDPARKLDIYAGAMHQIQARMAPLLLALRDASSTEPDALGSGGRSATGGRPTCASWRSDLDAAGGLRPGRPIDEAADVIWATNSPELYVLLTTERGWPPHRYERWLADTWRRLLLPAGGSA